MVGHGKDTSMKYSIYYLLIILIGLLAIVAFPTNGVYEIHSDDSVVLVKKAEALYEEHEVEKNIILAEVSAYTSSVDETDDTPFLTASGELTRKGVVACPSRFAFGQKLIIEGKTYECLDRMNKRYRDKNNFDIWVETKHEAYKWGRRKVSVEILPLEISQ